MDVKGSRPHLPLGRLRTMALDHLLELGLAEIAGADRHVTGSGIVIRDRARLTELGRAKAENVHLPDDD